MFFEITMDDTLRIASLNCRGLGEFTKRRDLFSYLRDKQFSIYLLQDTHFTPGIEDRITREWGYNAYFSSYRSNSRGVAILFNNNIDYKLIKMSKDTNGNLLVLHLSAFDKEFIVVNVYGPNADSPDFYTKMEEMIAAMGPVDNIIIGGDWNFVMNFDVDCFNYRHRNNINACEKVNDIMHNFDLLDIWREQHPETRRYTWRRSAPCQQSRLDFFLISNVLVTYTKEVDIKPGYRTDHSLITISMKFGEEVKRNQFWKFNTSLLSDKTYLDQINEVIKETIDYYAAFPYNRKTLDTISLEDINFTIDDQLFLDVLLMNIRSKTISYASFRKRKFEEAEKNLVDEIENLEKKEQLNDFEQELLDSKQEELVNIRDFRLKGVLLRSRARWVEDGEKPSSYFCSLEKRNYVNKCMNKITLDNDTCVTNKKEITNVVKDFYKDLYTKRDVQDAAVSDLVNNLPALSDIEANKLEGLLTLDEISYALKNMKNGKSPGSDGFPVEFFKVFWRQLGGLVLRSINEGFSKGQMSNTQKEGVIICIPKSDSDRDKLRNWRPISLLNTVYKIGSCSIANRLKTVLPDIINDDQTGFVRNRYIGDNIRLIYDTISYLSLNNEPGLLLCLDFEKAFDSLDWNFLHKVLNAFGFKHDICRWIKSFYTNIKSAVSVNGIVSEWFDVSRGCRQGDPISPYLFIICAEIMGCMIRENNNIKGITVNDNEIKLTQYADDSEIILNGDRQSFEETIQTVQSFSNVSGLKLNTNKTNSIWLGSRKNSHVRYMQHLNICWNPTKFKILGIWFSNDIANCFEYNYKDKLLEIKNLYKIWSKRQLTPLGRIAILKSLILSKLIYLWILLPNPPDVIINEIQSDIFEFVWNSKYDRINRKTSVKNIQCGGIGIPDVRRYISALKLSWIRKLIVSNHKWKNIILHVCPLTNDLVNFGSALPTRNLNVFWKDVFCAYQEMGSKVFVKEDSEFLSEPLFYNEKIKIGNNVIFRRNWFENGIFRVKHLLNGNGQFLTFADFVAKYNINDQDFLFYRGCVEAIQKYLRLCTIVLSSDISTENSKLFEVIHSCHKGAKFYYDFLVSDDVLPNFCTKWNEKLNLDVNWKLVFESNLRNTEIKFRWFQVRITTRIIGTNIILKAMKIKDDDLCTFCNEEPETIEHLFSECLFTLQFWNEIKCLLVQHNIVQDTFQITPYLILFCITNIDNIHKKIPLSLFKFLQIAKYFIYKSRCEECIPILASFKKYFRVYFETERFIALKNNVEDRFVIVWEEWKDLLDNFCP